MTQNEETRRALRSARRIAVMTGAGVSAESGVPTFRGAGGLWRNRSVMELATPQAFARDPLQVWEWYSWRRGLIAACEPNAGHIALVELERGAEHFTLITQNVDGLHTAAGSQAVLELHGNIWKLRCTQCKGVREHRQQPLDRLPHCNHCGALERPHIVWFGEPLEPAILDSAAEAASSADVLLVVGTSGVVQPAASLAYLTQRAGGFVAVINVEQTAHSDALNAMLMGPAASVLPELVEGLFDRA